MADEKKKISLEDLGLDTQTPAEKAAEEAKVVIQDDGTEVESIDGNALLASLPKDESEKEEPKHTILRPTSNDGTTDYGEIVTDVNKIAKNPIKKKVDPIRRTMDGLYDLADKGINRTKNEMMAPDGRINEAKRKYIEERYAKLESRAKVNKSVENKIKTINEIMETDPRFDGITEFERKGYILFSVAKDDKTGVDNKYFGIEEVKEDRVPRLSSMANDTISKATSKDEDDDFSYDMDDSVTIGENKTGKSILPDMSKAKVAPSDDNLSIEDNEPLLLDDKDDEVKDEKDLDEGDDPTEELSEEQLKKIRSDYRNQLIDVLNLNKSNEIDGFTIATKPIKLSTALKAKEIHPMSITWALQYTGVSIEMTPFSGDEIITLNPNNTSFTTVAGLKKVFSIIYHHIVNQNKPPFETWLRQISDFDIDGLLFAVYVANFKDTNFISYECSNKKCKKIFLEKKNIMDMVVFPNEDVKKRFNDILAQDTVSSQLYTSSPRLISDTYAIGFVSQSIYSNLFEPAALSEEFSKKYSSIIDIMPNIDKVYRIDKANKTLVPISFGVSDDSLSKTVMRKVRSLDAIFKTFTPDERSLAIAEARKIGNKFDQDKITYSIPSTVCPTCGETIASREMNPLNMLFTRAQLPIVAAYIPE
jgi:hypothetical protein